MSQKSQKNKHVNDNTPAFTSPDGILVRINRGGNKIQFIRDLCRNEEITHVQFRILVPLVDMSNEGTHEDSGRWGKAWMSVETLAKESGCSERAVQDNMPLLEAAGIVKVKRDLTDDGKPKGGRSNVNEFWLTGWNKFGAVVEDEKKGARGAPFGEKERVHAAPDKGARGSEKGAHRAPDSTYRPYAETQPKDSTAAASGERGPAAVDLSFDGSEQKPEPANGNEIAPWPVDIDARFMKIYPKGGDLRKISAALDEIRREGLTDYRDILRGATYYARDEARKIAAGYAMGPENFLTKRVYVGYQQNHRPKSEKKVAI